METSMVILSLAAVVAWFQVQRKARYPTGRALLMILLLAVPLVNLVVIASFIFSEWPIERELRALRCQLHGGTSEDAFALYSEGSRLEAKGDVQGALAKYQLAVATCPDSRGAQDAQAGIQNLKALVGQ
jgi:uncharacterized membrane protein